MQLNKTYLPYGKMGQAGQARQSAQDANAGNSSQSVLATRSVSKGNAFYCNDAWDLVDAIKNGKCKLEDLKTEDLPEDMRKLDQAGRKAKVDEARKQRAEIQAKILKLNKEREAFLAAERKKQLGRERADAGPSDLQDDPRSGRTQQLQVRVSSWTASESWWSRTMRQSGGAWSMRWASPDMPRWKRAKGPRGLPRPSSLTATCCLLDLVLPGRDGLAILRELRAMRRALPVIVLTARGSEDDRVRGLALGADDYVVKPFSIKELLARIEAVLRRAPARPPAVRRLAFEGGLADLERHEV